MSKNKWWSTWAPYWDNIEDRHFGLFALSKYLPYIKEPALVIGAGQGIIVEQLLKTGIKTCGLDLDPEMIRIARERRGIEIIQADAGKLPFSNHSFQSVIISSGVLDYTPDKYAAGNILAEALRVLIPYGHLFASFYTLSPEVEKEYKSIGIITSSPIENAPDYPDMSFYHIHRSFKMFQAVQKEKIPLKFINTLVKWTGHSCFFSMLRFIKLGIFLPAELKKDNIIIKEIISRAFKRDGLLPEDLFKHAPVNVPYRSAGQIENLLNETIKLPYSLSRYRDCFITHFHKSHFSCRYNREHENIPENKYWLIRTDSLVFSYSRAKRPAVDNLTLHIPRGSIYGLLGPNGAGKTTILALLCGLLKPDSGNIDFSDSIDKKNIRKHIGFIPQEIAIHKKLTAMENLHFFGSLYNMNKNAIEKSAEHLLEIVRLTDKKNDLVKTFSAGMMRRLNLAAGLLHNPDIILLDEPTVGIDPQSRNCIYEAIEQLKKQKVTILYTTHYMDEAYRLCDTLAIIDHGQKLLESSPGEIVGKYGMHILQIELPDGDQVEFFKTFLASVPSVYAVSPAVDNEKGITVYFENSRPALECIQDISKKADENSIVIKICSVREADLESVFLDITGRTIRDNLSGI